MVIVRGATFPGFHLGNSSLIDPEVSRYIVLHLAKGEPASDFMDGLVIEYGAYSLRWSVGHRYTWFMHDQS